MFPLKYTQNFFVNNHKIEKILSYLDSKLLTLEIGGGHGEFSRYLKIDSVILEKDNDLAAKLENYYPKLKIRNIDFLDFDLPSQDFQVFSNLPFAFTSEILVKLMKSDNFKLGVFIIQKEAAEMFLGIPRNNLKSVVYNNYFDLEIVMNLSKSDFKPSPSVETVVLIAKKRINPILEIDLDKFENLIREMGNVRIGEGKFWKNYDKKKLKSVCNDLGIEYGKGLFGNSREKIYGLIKN